MVSVGLAEVYTRLTPWVEPLWMSSLLVNTGLTVIVLGYTVRSKSSEIFRFHRFVWLGPIILVGSFLLSAVHAWWFQDAVRETWGPEQWIFVLWVPFVEDVVFRLGIGGWCRSQLGSWRGAYLSAMVFSFVHSMPTVHNLLKGEVGFALGPFFLALLGESLLIRTGSLLPSIVLHACCNATVMVFLGIDARVFEYFSWLYG